MRRTILKIEKDDGEPLEMEVNGRRLTGRFERGIFYIFVALLALGTLWVIVAVVLPLVGIVLGFLFSIVGFSIIVIAVVLVLVVLWLVVSRIQERSSGRRKRREGWEE